MTAVIIERRNGDGSVSIGSDLTQSTLELGPLAWRKPPGVVAKAAATLLISHDRLTKLDHLVVQGDEMTVNASANLVDGRIRSVLLDNVRLGRTQGHGTIYVKANDEIDIVLQGNQIDLSSKLTETSAVADASTDTAAPATTAPWRLDARFNHAILANGEIAIDLLANATGAGEAIGTLDVVGTTKTGGGFSIRIEPEAAKRHLTVKVKDAGRFLRGVDAVGNMATGHLAIDGEIDSPVGLHPLAGTATIDDVVLKNSPVLGKLLQVITLYGLVDVVRGPGMSFSHIVVPFRYDGVDLNLDGAHAANPSLGLTAKGRIGLSSGQLSVAGTIVPAYFFNAALGRLPLVGKFFSPEKGGGIFAARFRLDGSVEDPAISINPISALTPGFLRDIFGMFDKPGTSRPGTVSASP
jgi:AsmA-like C-terminal region